MRVVAIDRSRTWRDKSVAIINIDELLSIPCLIANDTVAGNKVCVMTVKGFDLGGICRCKTFEF